MSKDLLILRHAKSSWNTNAPSDFHRGLAPRGRDAAARIAGWLKEHGPLPDRVLASNAVRVVQTLEILLETCPVEAARITLSLDLYGASVPAWIDKIKHMPEDVGCLLICGHNPELEALAASLCRDVIEPQANGKLLPTATLIWLRVSAPWSTIGQGSATLQNITRPRELAPV